jgi:deazaflavin-dependent oxidoreductase (nitroreductase family)
MNTFPKRPTRLLKFFFKAPIWFHKLGFGGWERLIGAQWMFISTTGRKTGKRHEVMVDVMSYNKDNDTYYIEAAYGAYADWYKNIQHTPLFEAQVGHRKFKARAGALSSEGAGEMLVQFYRRKPAYTRSVMTMAGLNFKNEDELRKLGSQLLLLTIQPEMG